MSARAEALADRFEQANQAVIDCVLGTQGDVLSVTCAAEGWSAAALGAHIGGGHVGILGRLVKPVVNGEEIPPFQMSDFAEGNAKLARENAAMPRDQIVTLLWDNGAAAAAYVRSLSDEDLDRTTKLPVMGDQPISVEQIIEMVLIGHVLQHGQSLRQGLGIEGLEPSLVGAPASGHSVVGWLRIFARAGVQHPGPHS
jgi:DinB superfamily